MKKKMISKLLVAFLAVAIVFCSAPLSVFTGFDLFDFSISSEALELTEGIYSFKVSEEESIITYCDESVSGDVVIPSMLGGYPVVGIDDDAFYNCESLTSVTIPEGVVIIGWSAFSYCSNLNTVTIPDSVIGIGTGAFYNCTSLTDVYYNGTEEEWNKISIGTGNDSLLDANIYFIEGVHEHIYTSSVTTESTCTEDGVKTFICNCGDSYTETIPTSGHTWSKWVITAEASETSDGTKVRLCKVCEDVAEIETIPATGSGEGEKTGITITLTDENGNVVIKEIITDYDTDISFENGTYTLTISKENYVTRSFAVTASDNMFSSDLTLNKVGDITGDGKVNTIDVARANSQAKGVSDLSDYEFACADVTGDGKVNTIDVARMNSHAKGVTKLW